MQKQDLQTAFSTRQYMFSQDFEIYYYNNAPGNAVSPHSHDYYEFYFFLEGNIDIYIKEEPYHVKPGNFLIIPPGVEHYPHFLDDTTPYRRFILWISTDYCSKLTQASIDYAYLFQQVSTLKNYLFENDVITFNQIQSQIFSIIEEVKGNRFGKESCISLQINALLLYLNRLVYERNHVAGPNSTKDIHMAISQFISNHLDEDLSLERLEKEFFASKYYISHVFKDNIGISIHQYITKKRLQACKDAILSGYSITSAYELYGFKDYSAFFRAFKKEYGLSPKEFRQMYLSTV